MAMKLVLEEIREEESIGIGDDLLKRIDRVAKYFNQDRLTVITRYINKGLTWDEDTIGTEPKAMSKPAEPTVRKERKFTNTAPKPIDVTPTPEVDIPEISVHEKTEKIKVEELLEDENLRVQKNNISDLSVDELEGLLSPEDLAEINGLSGANNSSSDDEDDDSEDTVEEEDERKKLTQADIENMGL